jgi:nucleoside-diphosphate-sugar epimerase
MIVSLARNLPIREKINALNPSATRKPSDLTPIKEVTDNTSSLDKLPELWLEKTFTVPFHFSSKGAAEILGFKPQVSFEEGMKKTEKWLRDSGVTVYTASFETSIMPELNVTQNFTRARTKVS